MDHVELIVDTELINPTTVRDDCRCLPRGFDALGAGDLTGRHQILSLRSKTLRPAEQNQDAQMTGGSGGRAGGRSERATSDLVQLGKTWA